MGFEDAYDVKNKINPDSLKPESSNPSSYKSQYKSHDPYSPDYHDSPEYRKSLHLEGAEKEPLLQQLRERLGLTKKVGGNMNENVKTFVGHAETAPAASASSSFASSSSSASSSGYEAQY